MICLTTSAEELRSMRRLWIRIWYLSQVLEPSPQGLKELFISPHFLPARKLKKRDHKNVRLPGGVLEDLGGESDGAPDVEVSVLGTVDEVGTDYRKFHQHFSPRFEEPSDGPIEKKKKN